MQALKIRVDVKDHRIAGVLPAMVPDGVADAVILFREECESDQRPARRQHLEALFARIAQRPGSGRSREEIDRQIAEERAGWEK